MPKKPNAHGMQEYIPAGNGDASGEYANEEGGNRSFKAFKKPENKYTDQQKARIDRFQSVLDNDTARGYVKGTFKHSLLDDGRVLYSYETKRNYVREHVGKMLSPDKADLIERTEINSGYFGKDGLWIKNKPETTEKIIKRGKR